MVSNILYGGSDVPQFADPRQPFGELVLQKLSEYSENIIFIDSDLDIKYNGKYLREQIIYFGKILRKFDINAGDRIGLCSENRFEFMITVFAAYCVGATVATYSPAYTYDELKHTIGIAKPKLIITSIRPIQHIVKIANESSYIKTVISFDESNLPNVVSFQSLFETNKNLLKASFKCAEFGDHQTMNILCSSGTTGLPKGVEILKLNVFTMLGLFKDTVKRLKAEYGCLIAADFLPWFHSYGLLVMEMLVLNGATVVTAVSFTEKKFYAAIDKYRINVAFVVPPILVLMAKSKLTDSFSLTSLVQITCGAAPLRNETIEALKTKLPNCILTQGYGLSETALSVFESDETTAPGSCGVLQPGMWGKVIDSKTHDALEPYAEGELCFKGPLVMKGYLGNASASADTIDPNGWLHTGDIGYYNDRNEWFIVDRLKELIKYKGFQVPPAELESLLLTHPHLVDAAVIGLPDDECGELPLAFVVKRSGTSVTEKEIIDFVAAKTSNPKRLRGGVRFISVIPKNLTGKILRRKLREMALTTKEKL